MAAGPEDARRQLLVLAAEQVLRTHSAEIDFN